MRYDKSSYHRGMFLTSYPVVTKSDTPARYGLPLKNTQANATSLAEIARSVRRGTALNVSRSLQKAGQIRAEMPRATRRRRSNE